MTPSISKAFDHLAMADAAVARAALAWFAATPAAQRKVPKGREWTVLAAFVVLTRGSSEGRVVAAATGNKCVGRRELDVDGLVVNDCHAEVLARRALLRYLYADAIAFHQGGDRSASLFEWREGTQRLALRAEHSLHLYISEAPCGDAAIYALRDDVVDELVSQRAERDRRQQQRLDTNTVEQHQHGGVERSALRLTGAKARHQSDRSDNGQRASKRARQETDSIPSGPFDREHKFAQLVGVARVKSGRSDLPPDKQTLSMSCSDKIARWTAVGVQGSLLLRFFDPLFLSSLVVPRDPRAATLDAQLEAMQRAVVTRLETTTTIAFRAFPACQLAVVSDESLVFDRSKALAPLEALQPSPLALNWTRRESHWMKDAKEMPTMPEAGIDQQWMGRFLLGADVEVLMAATGLKQGAKKASKLDRVGMERVASRLAKRNLFRAFCLIHQLANKISPHASGTSESDSEDTSTLSPLQLGYQQVKERIVSTPSPAADGDSSSTSWDVYVHRRRQFASEFQGWVGVPSEWKAFSLS